MSHSKCVSIGGVEFSINGADTDRYFQNIDAFACETNPLFSFVKRYIRNEGVILDVGGNIGMTSLAMSVARPCSNIIAFEPSPVNAEFFRKNTEHNINISLIQSGVSNENASLSFVVPPDGANAHVATENYMYANHPDFHPITVPVVRLDDFYHKGNISSQCSLIKIDVEGFEPNVLAGAGDLIEKERPWIWMEFNSVALNVAHGYSPMAFATGLFKKFEVYKLNTECELIKIPSPAALVHDNMVANRSIEDIVLKPIAGRNMPSLEEFILPLTVSDQLNMLRQSTNMPKSS